MKTLKFKHFATPLLFCCAVLTAGLFSKSLSAQNCTPDLMDSRNYTYYTVSEEQIDQLCSDAVTLLGGGLGTPTLCPYGAPQVGYIGSFPFGTGVYTTAPTVNPGPIGTAVSGGYILTNSFPDEYKAVQKQIPDSVTIGKVVPINQLILPGQFITTR